MFGNHGHGLGAFPAVSTFLGLGMSPCTDRVSGSGLYVGASAALKCESIKKSA